MIRKILSKGLLVLLLVFILILFSSGTGSEGIVKNALCKRTNAMNDFYLGKLTYQEACEKLSDIEQGRLLDDDRNSLKSFFGTDIEEVVGYDVRDIVIHYEDEEVICAFLSVEWQVNGADGLYRDSDLQKIVGNYSVILEKSDNIFKFVQFY